MKLMQNRHPSLVAIILTATCISPAIFAQNSSVMQPATAAQKSTPFWAYPVDPPGVAFTPMIKAYQEDQHQTAVDNDAPIHLPGAEIALSLNQVRKGMDWHPNDHPPMPEVVANGRKPEMMYGCSFCHAPNGQGRPSTSSRLAGLPASYMRDQLADFKNGLRKSSEPRFSPPALMIDVSKAMTDSEINAAVEYFSGLTYKPWIRVVECATVPKTRLAGGELIPVQPVIMEPMGERIIEVPESVERTALHDSASGFVAYVPMGSVKKGENLVRTGGAKVVAGKIVAGRTIPCGLCHGPDLKGLGNVPAIAGGSATYAFRQLYDFQHGTRNGKGAELMKPVVSNLRDDDFVSIAAYLASSRLLKNSKSL
jgi:cytochrome c553